MLELLDLLGESLLAEDANNIRELVAAGEPGVALEIMCDQLCEYDVPLSPRVLTTIHELISIMKLDPEYAEGLHATDA